MIELPTELRAGLPFAGPQMGEHEQGDGGHAAKFHENAHPSPSPVFGKPQSKILNHILIKSP
ncbi:MAG: hypothetical protein WA322_26160 [Pseudolabrys sp.]